MKKMNVFDYLKWRGDLSFKQDPFNEVDNLIVCELTYVDLRAYFSSSNKYTIEELNRIYFKDHSIEDVYKETGLLAGTSLILKAMAETKRFKNCVIFNYVFKNDEETKEQFGAFELDLKDGTTYVAFEGTDDSLIGWHEDFRLMYTKISAQEEAYNYLNNAIKPFKKYRVGGHSKGGHLAIYASLLLAKKHKNIVNIYSNDGPGLNKELLPDNYEELFELIKDKYIKFVPEFDIFGTIYDISTNKVVIKSSASGILQHGSYTWLVEGNKLVRGQESEDSRLIRNSFKEFFESVNFEQRKEFVEELFAALKKAGIRSLDEFSNGGITIFIQTIRNLSNMNDTSKKVASTLIKTFGNKYMDNFTKEVTGIKDNVLKQADSIIKSITNKKD